MTPRTVVIPGNGTNVLSFTIPAGVDFNVESVVASVDAAAAGDTIGELAVAEVTGAVIATKRQGLPIPGGGSGTETWALRLDDEGAGTPSGGGWDFNKDNVGGWGLLETIGEPTIPPSQPTSFVPGDDESIASFLVNSDEGTVFTNNPAYGLPVIIIEAGVGATAAADALDIRTNSSGGSGATQGIHGDVRSGSGLAQGIALGVDATTGAIAGVDVDAAQSSGAATASTVGVNALATSQGSGDTIGVQGQSHAFGAGLACALRCLDHNGNTIFEVRDDGSIHGLAAVGAITWDL